MQNAYRRFAEFSVRTNILAPNPNGRTAKRFYLFVVDRAYSDIPDEGLVIDIDSSSKSKMLPPMSLVLVVRKKTISISSLVQRACHLKHMLMT